MFLTELFAIKMYVIPNGSTILTYKSPPKVNFFTGYFYLELNGYMRYLAYP
jgi:hypothetical protein